MITTNIIFALLMGTACLTGLYWAYANHRRYKLNLVVADELDALIQSALAAAAEAKKGGSRQSPADAPHNLDSPIMLSTILTVLINKFGDVRLSMTDFLIPDDEYVSVYVDTTTKELILSMSHSLTTDDLTSMVGYTDPDDNTFH
jgi:hypothetical protein